MIVSSGSSVLYPIMPNFPRQFYPPSLSVDLDYVPAVGTIYPHGPRFDRYPRWLRNRCIPIDGPFGCKACTNDVHCMLSIRFRRRTARPEVVRWPRVARTGRRKHTRLMWRDNRLTQRLCSERNYVDQCLRESGFALLSIQDTHDREIQDD